MQPSEIRELVEHVELASAVASLAVLALADDPAHTRLAMELGNAAEHLIRATDVLAKHDEGLQMKRYTRDIVSFLAERRAAGVSWGDIESGGAVYLGWASATTRRRVSDAMKP